MEWTTANVSAKSKTPHGRKPARSARGFAEDKANWVSPPVGAPPQAGVAKLFMNGRSQAVRLPKEFRLPGTRVRVRREGDNIVLTPWTKRDLGEALDEIHRLVRGQFPAREQPPMPADDDLDPFD